MRSEDFYTYLLFIELNMVHKQKVFATSCVSYQLKIAKEFNRLDLKLKTRGHHIKGRGRF